MKSLFTAYWAFTKNMEKGIKSFGLNYGNPKVILYLMNHEGCRQIDIARNCFGGVTTGDASGNIVNRIVQYGSKRFDRETAP